MSKQMKSAYFALRLKDTFTYIADAMLAPMIFAFAIALLLCDTGAFGIALVVASVVSGAWMLVRLIAILCNRRMLSMGFSEVELERLALA